jgi:hypothetical protein
MNDMMKSGAISGALDPNSKEASDHAKLYYDEIRNNHSDVKKIASFLNKSEEQILLVKNYLFNDLHVLDGKIARFDPEIHIAQSWQRLAFDQDNVLPHDMILIQHEMMELNLVNSGVSQSEAHNITNKQYNYTEACDLYDKKMGFETGHYITTQSGAITRLDYFTH